MMLMRGRNQRSTCDIKCFRNNSGMENNMSCRISNCGNKILYNELVTSTVDPKMSAKMRISQYLRSYKCIPSSYSKYA
jgi:hypothetical protein